MNDQPPSLPLSHTPPETKVKKTKYQEEEEQMPMKIIDQIKRRKTKKKTHDDNERLNDVCRGAGRIFFSLFFSFLFLMVTLGVCDTCHLTGLFVPSYASVSLLLINFISTPKNRKYLNACLCVYVCVCGLCRCVDVYEWVLFRIHIPDPSMIHVTVFYFNFFLYVCITWLNNSFLFFYFF